MTNKVTRWMNRKIISTYLLNNTQCSGKLVVSEPAIALFLDLSLSLRFFLLFSQTKPHFTMWILILGRNRSPDSTTKRPWWLWGVCMSILTHSTYKRAHPQCPASSFKSPHLLYHSSTEFSACLERGLIRRLLLTTMSSSPAVVPLGMYFHRHQGFLCSFFFYLFAFRSTFARVLLDKVPGVKICMIEMGAKDNPIHGRHHKNSIK
jgi:hypothetical protein